jgi:hypothetical protein
MSKSIRFTIPGRRYVYRVAVRQSRSSNLRKIHGAEKAAAMTKNLMQSWQPKRSINPEVQGPMHSATASSTAFATATSLQTHSQFRIPTHSVPNEGVSAPPQRRQEWTSAPTISGDERLAPSQPHVLATSTLASPLRPHADNLAPQANVSQGIVSPQKFPTAPSSQSHSILLAPEEKSTALYTMRGLAASIKRSLNAERLAASEQPTATSETHAETRKPSPSVEVVEVAEQFGPETLPTADTVETVPVLHLDGGENPPSATAPSPFPQVSLSQGETASPPDDATIPNTFQEPSLDFVPFSTLAGAVSFDNATSYAPADHPTIPSPVVSTFEGLMDPQQAPDVLPHDHMDIDVPMLSFTEASFNGLSFPTRTPTPPLSAMITPFRDDDGANAKTQETPSFIPTSPRLDQVEIQPESISPASESGLEAMVISADDVCEDQDRIGFNVTHLSSEQATHPEAQILNSPKEESRVFVRRTGLLDSSIEDISGEPLESMRTEGYPGDETRKHVRTSEVSPVVHTSTRPTSTSPAATLGSSAFLKPPMQSAGKPTFYVAVPPRPEWVRSAKRREAANKRLASEEIGELYTLEPLCSFLIFSGQRSDRGS